MNDSPSPSSVADLRVFRALPEEQLPAPGTEAPALRHLAPPPPWRCYSEEQDRRRGEGFVAPPGIDVLVNTALTLRRPILVEGHPGAGKTSLAYAVARELNLPGPYRWSVTSRSILQDALYQYDAIGRLHLANLAPEEERKSGRAAPVEEFVRLGPLGMAFVTSRRASGQVPALPAVLLIDEIDKSDIDLPNDLLHVFEEGWFEIPELVRDKAGEHRVLPYRTRASAGTEERVRVRDGVVRCEEFPFVVMTSNSEREFPPAFLRRCLRVVMETPTRVEDYLAIVRNRFGDANLKNVEPEARELIEAFLLKIREEKASLATDQLLNGIHLLLERGEVSQEVRDIVFHPLR